MKNYKTWVRLFFVAYLLCVFYFADHFQYMILNVFLAYIPIEISFWMEKEKMTSNILFCILGVIWLLFFPNVPYLVTDFFHLRVLNPETSSVGVMLSTPYIWKNFLILTAGIFPFVITGFQGMYQVVTETTRRFFKNNPIIFVSFVGVISVLSSIAIYWGRILRLHSIHVITKPLRTLEMIIQGISPDMVWFVLGFTILHFLLFFFINQQKLCKKN